MTPLVDRTAINMDEETIGLINFLNRACCSYFVPDVTGIFLIQTSVLKVDALSH
jgi:hypothetical protein